MLGLSHHLKRLPESTHGVFSAILAFVLICMPACVCTRRRRRGGGVGGRGGVAAELPGEKYVTTREKERHTHAQISGVQTVLWMKVGFVDGLPRKALAGTL